MSPRPWQRSAIDISREFPKPWTDEFLGAADVVVTMGCGDSCPLVPGKRYEDWDLEDPTDKSLEEIRPIREAVRDRVETLLAEILPAVSHDGGAMSDIEIRAMRKRD